jgi:hypothetical protein
MREQSDSAAPDGWRSSTTTANLSLGQPLPAKDTGFLSFARNEDDPTSDTGIPRVHRLKLYYEQHEPKLAIAFFIGGFLFDVLTLGRVDSWLTIGQESSIWR